MIQADSNPNQNLQITRIRQEVQSSVEELRGLIYGPFSQLPTEKLYQRPAENEWTLMENIAHIIEFMPYWGNEISKLVKNPDQPFGRTMEDPGRLRGISEHSHDTLPQTLANLNSSYAHLDSVLQSLHDSDLAITGLHKKFGQRTLAWFIEEFVTRHLRAHLEQIQQCLAAIE